jgi:serine/threonine-protein kinase
MKRFYIPPWYTVPMTLDDLARVLDDLDVPPSIRASILARVRSGVEADPNETVEVRAESGWLGEYADLGIVGAGAMGTVHKVEDAELKRTMVMKVVHPRLLGRQDLMARFVAEAQVTAQLDHPGIAPVHQLGALPDGRLYFTMKELRGRELAEVIEELHEASPDDTWNVTPSGWTFRKVIDALHTVCETVAYAHDRGVIHRDIKPANVVVGGFGEVLVVDWGLAKVLGAADTPDPDAVRTGRTDDDALATQVGTVAGTPMYMPPEQARGDLAQLGPASDVYSLGAVLYEVLSGRPPYDGRGGHAVLQQLLSGPPPSDPGRGKPRSAESTFFFGMEMDGAREGGPPVPQQLREVCLRAMAREPAQRYPNAASLAEAIAGWLAGERRRDEALAHVDKAAGRLERSKRLSAEAMRLRAEAEHALRDISPTAPASEKEPAWELEDRAGELLRTASLAEVEYTQLLLGALTIDPELREAHSRLAGFYQEEHAAAERAGVDASRFEILIRAHDDGTHRPYLAGVGALTLRTDPPRADVELSRFVERGRRLVPETVRVLGRTPLDAVPLQMGSWLLTIRAPGCIPVVYPVFIHRNEHWDGIRPGDATPFPIRLPRAGELGPDDCYVPAGWTWVGGDPEAPGALRRRRVWVDPLVVRKYTVTNRDYLAYLDTLPPDVAAAVQPRERGTGEPVYARTASGHSLKPDEHGDLWDPDWPVLMVDHGMAAAYCAWLADADGVGWRLPAELEWEKAARGVDGRLFPWGNHLDPTWCAYYASHIGRKLPVRVVDFPTDSSVYGVRGMAGNVREWCADDWSDAGPPETPRVEVQPATTGYRVVRGGTWQGHPRDARLAARRQHRDTYRDAILSLRAFRDA